MDNTFYVYLYMDPRKKGIYTFHNVGVQNEPIYVGKGKGKRYMAHLKRRRKGPFLEKIKKIRNEGLEPKILILASDITENEAFEIEKIFINAIGRKDLGTGTLVNLTDGGEGTSGVKWTEERKNKFRGKNNPIHKSNKKHYKSGPDNPQYGKKRPRNVIEKGIKTRKENYQKNSGLQKKKSENISGSKNPGYGKIGILNSSAKPLIINGDAYQSLKEANEKTTFSKYEIRKFCNDETVSNFKWITVCEYVTMKGHS